MVYERGIVRKRKKLEGSREGGKETAAIFIADQVPWVDERAPRNEEELKSRRVRR